MVKLEQAQVEDLAIPFEKVKHSRVQEVAILWFQQHVVSSPLVSFLLQAMQITSLVFHNSSLRSEIVLHFDVSSGSYMGIHDLNLRLWGLKLKELRYSENVNETFLFISLRGFFSLGVCISRTKKIQW
jgi:hypothetical protein